MLKSAKEQAFMTGQTAGNLQSSAGDLPSRGDEKAEILQEVGKPPLCDRPPFLEVKIG